MSRNIKLFLETFDRGTLFTAHPESPTYGNDIHKFYREIYFYTVHFSTLHR